MTTRGTARALLPVLALSMLGLAANPRHVIAQPAPVAASAQKSAAAYRCLVTTKDGRIEKTGVKAETEDAAKKAAVKKIGSRAVGMSDVSCAPSTESPAQSADSSPQKGGPKTRAPTPPVFAPRSPIEFEKDGSCRLSQEAAISRPTALDKCRELSSAEGGGFACPPDYCKALR